MQESKSLTLVEAADRLGIKPRLLRHWVEQGRVPHLRLGERTLRFRESDLAAFEKEHLRSGLATREVDHA